MDLLSTYSGFGYAESLGIPSYVLWPMIIFILLLIVFISMLYTNQNPGVKDYMPDMVQLNMANYPLGSNQAHQILFSGSGATVAGLFNVTIGDRTNQSVISTTNNYTTLFGVRGSIEFQLAPASVSTTDSTARLLIASQGGAELVPLPPLPAQKWVFIAILRDGRRFDVLYNDRIVGSHRLNAFPNVGVQNQFQVGSDPRTPTAPARFLGQAIHLFAINSRMSPADLAVLRAKFVDTTGAPPDPLPFPFPLTMPSLQTLCIPGVPCSPVNKPPPNHLQAWSSPYA